MEISYATDNFLKLLYMLAYLKNPNIPVGRNTTDFELSLACIRLVNFYSGGAVNIELFPEFGTNFKKLRFLNKINQELNKYIHLPLEEGKYTVSEVALNKILDNELFEIVKDYVSWYRYVCATEQKYMFSNIIEDLYPKLMANFGLNDTLMKFIFNEYRRQYKNRHKITIKLDDISKKISLRIENLKNKPPAGSVLGAMTLVHYCAQKYNYKITDIDFSNSENLVTIKQKVSSSYHTALCINDNDDFYYVFQLYEHYNISFTKYNSGGEKKEVRTCQLKRVEYTFLKILMEYPLGIHENELAKKLDLYVNRIDKQSYCPKNINTISRNLRYQLKHKLCLVNETQFGGFIFSYENFIYKFEKYIHVLLEQK